MLPDAWPPLQTEGGHLEVIASAGATAQGGSYCYQWG